MRWSPLRAQLEMLLASMLLFSICQCQGRPDDFDDVESENENNDWLAGVYTPQPLRPAPWEVPTPPPPAVGGSLQIPGVGQVVGLPGYKVIRNRPVDAYLGIRYAKVSAGLGRFQQARSVPYQGLVNATRASANCAQFPEIARIQDDEAQGKNVDDCLTLDIYAPSGASNLPVIVFVHGEMLFDGGSEEAQPDYILEHDVVLVSINYRLAPFGFLSALNDQLPGNVALSDIHLALQWLQRNLRYFGGNSNKITLLGQAGGATLVHALSLSGKAQNLFQQLILQSGTALNPYFIDERPLETLSTFARIARCPNAGHNLAPLYDCLGRLRTSELLSTFQQLYKQNEPRGLTYLGGFKLVVGDSLGYLPQHPSNLVANNQNSSVPLIIGATKDASAFILSRFYQEIQLLRSQNVSDYINVVLRHIAPPQHHKIWHDWALREIFTPDQTSHYIDARSVSQNLLELSNLILYREPVIDSIRFSFKKNPTYLYIFDYRGEFHRFGHFNNPLPFGVDASLSDDSVYLFPYPVETSQLNPEDKSIARALVTMWVNFANSGIPNPNSGVWPKATSEYGPFLRFTNSKENVLELDQHFGEGINVPNLYGYNQLLNTSRSTPVTYTTRTTTTTTIRPYVYNPYAQRQPIRPTPVQPEQRRPTDQSRYDQYLRDQERRRQHYEREKHEREERERAQQQLREQHEREEQNREEDERAKQRELQEQQERADREQRLQEERQRQLQQQEQEEREQQERREQQQREDEQRDNEEKEQLEREKQRKDELQREQWDREQPQEAYNGEEEENPVLGNEPSVYPSYEDYPRAEQPHQQQEEQDQENTSYEDYLRALQQHQQQEENQDNFNSQEGTDTDPGTDQLQPAEEQGPIDTDPSAYPSYEDYLRANQPAEEVPKENPVIDRDDPRSYPSYEAYVEAQMKLREEEELRYEQERAREEEREEAGDTLHRLFF